MLELWVNNRSEEEMEAIYNRRHHKQSPRWSFGFGRRHNIIQDGMAKCDLEECLEHTSNVCFGDIHTTNGKRQYQPGIRNMNRKNPERSRSWKDQMGSKKHNQHK